MIDLHGPESTTAAPRASAAPTTIQEYRQYRNTIISESVRAAGSDSAANGKGACSRAQWLALRCLHAGVYQAAQAEHRGREIDADADSNGASLSRCSRITRARRAHMMLVRTSSRG
jgi:hypothetical protein